MTDLATYTTDETLHVTIKGQLPNGGIIRAFGDPMKVESFESIEDYSKLKLAATQGNAGGVAAVVTQRLVVS